MIAVDRAEAPGWSITAGAPSLTPVIPSAAEFPTLPSTVDPASPAHVANRDVMLERIHELAGHLEDSRAGGGSTYIQRHRDRGKLLVRERIELLVDQDAPFLELSPLAGVGTGSQLPNTPLTP